MKCMFSSMNYAEFFRGYHLPADDSDSGSSADSSCEGDLCDTSNLVGNKKRSFIRRLERRLKFLLLPSPNGVPAPYSSVPMFVLRGKLITYFESAGVEPLIYETWFIR